MLYRAFFSQSGLLQRLILLQRQHFPEEMNLEGNGNEEGKQIRAGLCHLHTGHIEDCWKQKNQWDEADALAETGQDRSRNPEAQALIDLVHIRRVAHEWHNRAGEVQRSCTDPENIRIIRAEPGDYCGSIQRQQNGSRRTDHSSQQRSEAESLTYPALISGAVIITGNWLEALANADDQVADQHVDLIRNRNGGNGSVAEDSRLYIQHGGREASQSLAANRREAAGDNQRIIRKFMADIFELQRDDALSANEYQCQDKAADALAQNRCKCGSRNTHVEVENEQRVQEHI